MRRTKLLPLICSCVLLLSLHNPPTTAQDNPQGDIHDNSDWWSKLRTEDSANIAEQEREPAKSNFTILGVSLSDDDDPLEKATMKLGKAQLVGRGDASTGRFQICYTSINGHPKVYLIFERGEVTDSFYLFAGGRHWNGENVCAKSDVLTENVSVDSGLRLGQTPSEVKAILGKPSAVAKNKIMYLFGVQKKTSDNDFAKLRKAYPKLNEDELRRNYGFYSLIVYMEARFTESKLTYLAVSRAGDLPPIFGPVIS